MIAKKITVEEMQRYHRTFSGKIGLWTLGHMIMELGTFDDNVNVEDTGAMTLRNYGIHLLRYVGPLADWNREEALSRLMGIPVGPPGEKKGPQNMLKEDNN